MRAYIVRYCKRMLPVKGIEWLDTLLINNKITQEEYDSIIG